MTQKTVQQTTSKFHQAFPTIIYEKKLGGFLPSLYNSFEDKVTIYLTLEYASKGNLFYLIRKEKFLSEDTAFYFFIQVCSGIYYLHK